LFGWNRENGSLGNGVIGLVQSMKVLQETLQGRIGTFVGFLRLMIDLKEKVRGSDYTKAIKNSRTNLHVENIEIIQIQNQSVPQNKLFSFLFY
jgi:hypothetical protein